MTTQDRLFLIVFDREIGTSTVRDLGHNLTAAMDLLISREREISENPNLEVVLVGSPSLDTLRNTHSSYFGASEALRPVLAQAQD